MFRPAEVRARFPIEKYFKEGRRRELRALAGCRHLIITTDGVGRAR
jgi:hypothetical protein